MTKHEKAEQICNKIGIPFLSNYKSTGGTITVPFLKAVFEEKFGRTPVNVNKQDIARELYEEMNLTFDEAKHLSTGSTVTLEFLEGLYYNI